MAPRTRHRPRRGGGDSDPLIGGDSGTYAGPQGGAEPGATETGDLESREFGVPQADIPGGKQHIVNLPTHPHRPGPDEVIIRPADLHKFHGVEPHDLGGYETPPDATADLDAPRPEPEEHLTDAVPVYIVPRPVGKDDIRRSSPQRIAVPQFGNPPVRVCSENRHRTGILLLNESATIIRIGENEVDAATRGAALPASMTNYLWIATQDSLYAVADSGTSELLLSVIQEFGQAFQQ